MSYEVLYRYCQLYKYRFGVSVIYSSFYYCFNFELLLHYVVCCIAVQPQLRRAPRAGGTPECISVTGCLHARSRIWKAWFQGVVTCRGGLYVAWSKRPFPRWPRAYP